MVYYKKLLVCIRMIFLQMMKKLKIPLVVFLYTGMMIMIILVMIFMVING